MRLSFSHCSAFGLVAGLVSGFIWPRLSTSFRRARSLPNLALWDQGAPPSAARGPVALAAVPRPARHTGLPLRSRPGAGRTAAPRPDGGAANDGARDHGAVGDERHA
jgi:hypothetical protein